ncbi:D-alanyl-D-alanine carboxypeptidase/D-alanyl-D-alanine-endopeptidase [Desulfobulbus oligotrophicus]|uniref:D-alanyl-D-alanine carboxypeptidase n=1 Tax=Desulfobulbus oligotrophicus TaxID=1909699 RepID=A0A7T6ARU8_9BACT|nr:D-alanyl-D-alanine carboxypeptidase [Desulfobulbus oligotrophicus]QQG66877.1 D-alanyl-D-alanine carboxypeptidase [Desulfobulbus oligotrophicus]
MPRWLACPRSVEQQTGRTARWLRSFSHRSCFCLLALLVVCPPQPGFADCRLLADLAPQGAYGVADGNGRIIQACRPDQPMVPASVLKIATVSAALAMFGPDHRFRTDFFLDRSGNLYVKGWGDPTLVSEEIAAVVQELRQRGIHHINTLYVDTSAFALTAQTPGSEQSTNPYDAPVGPLSVNFNSVAIVKEPNGRIVSGEAQTPTLPIMQTLGRGLSLGAHRINICTGGCDVEARTAQYAGELFQAFLQRAGIPVDRLGGQQIVPEDAGHLYTHYSTRSLVEVSQSMLYYSSNFTANLVFLACGAKRYGFPATWDKAVQAVHQELVQQLGPDTADEIMQVEGAGLSRRNRVTVQAMLQLLNRFRPQIDLLKNEHGIRMKTGTLTGVYNLAGYLPGGQAFVVLLNQSTNVRGEVLDRLVRRYAVGPSSTLSAQFSPVH